MKRNNQKHRITKHTKLAFKRETIMTLASQQLELVAGGFNSVSCDTPTCSSGDPICDPY